MENGYTSLPDTSPVDEHTDKLAAFRREFADKQKAKGAQEARDSFPATAERLEELTRPREPSQMDTLQAALSPSPELSETPPEPPMANGWPRVEVRVSPAEKEAWMSHAYQRGDNLSEFIRRTMNGIVDEES
jgi:hypothetical protein